MALRIFQFCALFAIVYSSGPDTSFGKAFQTPGIDLSLNLTDPKDVIVRKGQSATLRCDVKSSLDGLEVTWFHNNDTVPENDTRWIVQDDFSLYVPKVSAGKRSNGVAGEYQCLARNRAGALLSNVAKLKVASMERDFSKNPSNSTISESQPAILFCNIRSTPPVGIQWEYNNLPLPQNTRYVPLPSGALLIYNSQIRDSGYYRCKATNDILNKSKYSATAFLKVSPRPTKEEAPTFLPLDVSSNSTVLLGDDVDLYCAAKGWPTPTVQWLDGSGAIISNKTRLHIPKADLSHSGSYTCLARNALGDSTLRHLLQVYEVPRFLLKPSSKSYPMASTVRLECETRGQPPPDIRWLKDGKPLPVDGVSKKQQSSGLVVLPSTFSRDSGLYQCIAVNPAGIVWSAARIEINVSNMPNPPENLQCRSYDATSICLNWRPPPNIIVQGYSIHPFYDVNGTTHSEPDFVSKHTFYHVMGLNNSTKYTFYVRGYSTAASDDSEKVTCKPGITGSRNLDIELIKADSVMLRWSEISTDMSCEGYKGHYRVQWRKEGFSIFNVQRTAIYKYVITGLSPGADYEFRVVSNYSKEEDTFPWILYSIPDVGNNTKPSDLDYENADSTQSTPLPPKLLEGLPVSTTAVKLTWTNYRKKFKYFSLCYVIADSGKECEDGTMVKSFSNKLLVNKLKPNTKYEFKVRIHSLDGGPGPFSQPVQIKTPADVPSPVQDLKYKVINDTTACLRWQAPLHRNGAVVLSYIMSYTPDRNWPLEKWIDVTVPMHGGHSTTSRCWNEEKNDSVTALLGNLNVDAQYMVLVRAVSDIGVGKPIIPITVTTKVAKEIPSPDLQNEIQYHKKIGIIIGTITSLICVLCCIACILVRRRCLKRRAVARARTAASNNYYPASARYATRVGQVQVGLEEPCRLSDGDKQESESLVSDEQRNTNIPPVSASVFDTKGGEEFPNGYLNGSAKPSINNHFSNTNVHITENPQFYAYECNGHVKTPKPITIPLQFEEDSNSNVKSSKFYDLYRLFENSKKSKAASPDKDPHHQCDPHFDDRVREVRRSRESTDFSPNSTQLTCLDDSLNTSINRRISPILGPNG